MLKKKEWLRRYKELMFESGVLSAYDIQESIKWADEGWKKGLSPGEAADEVNDFATDCIFIAGGIIKC